jgi:hypothetical protein
LAKKLDLKRLRVAFVNPRIADRYGEFQKDYQEIFGHCNGKRQWEENHENKTRFRRGWAKKICRRVCLCALRFWIAFAIC